MSEASAGMHCYESEELDSVASDDEDSEQAAFPQANPDAPVREVRLELGMEFENLDHFKKAVRKFNINLGRSVFFPRVDSTRPPTAKKPPRKKKNLRRPPLTTHQPHSAPATPTTTTPSPTASDVPPTVTPQTMQAASEGTTSRFMEFMPSPTGIGSSSGRWSQPAFRPPPKKRSTTAHLKEGSSGSSNSTPIP
ncbi:hypothetical protein Ahy_B08g093647 [Arachis hypogaea]|uniref:Uncharacterized protein n=1 Tax=Arachis hypogaea TaxID=3818 RepID=A0A444Y6L1_ARAHY|nr:hypothetical protein Ahy_B08g093647 [Arachis hypogaea]